MSCLLEWILLWLIRAEMLAVWKLHLLLPVGTIQPLQRQYLQDDRGMSGGWSICLNHLNPQQEMKINMPPRLHPSPSICMYVYARFTKIVMTRLMPPDCPSWWGLETPM